MYSLLTSQFPHVFSADYNSKQREVAILIIGNKCFTTTNSIPDPDSRFIIVNLSIHNKDICIANIYTAQISAHSDTTFIIGGDFNLVFNPVVGRLSSAESYSNLSNLQKF